MAGENITITSEAQAFELIQQALNKQIPENVIITFKNWPILSIELEGDGYEGTITPSMMRSLVDFQDGLNRTYAKLVHNESSITHLKASEKQELEFKAQVKNKCSLINVDITEFAQKTVTELMTKMEPTHLVILGVSAMVIWVGGSIWKKHLELASQHKTLSAQGEQALAMSEEETKRLQIVTSAMKTEARLLQVQNEAYTAQVGVLKGVSDAESIEINGIKFMREDAKQIARAVRTEAIDVQINGHYHILSVDTSHESEVKLKLKYLENGEEFSAKFKDQTLDQAQISLLQDAEWAKPKKKIYLSVNATRLRGEITTATVVSVTA